MSPLRTFASACSRLFQAGASTHAKLEDYKRHINIERSLTPFSGYAGVDFSGCDLDTRLDYFECFGSRRRIATFLRSESTFARIFMLHA